MTLLPVLVLVAAGAFAGPPIRVAEPPAQPQAAPGLELRAQAAAAAASPVIAPPADGLWLSQDVARNRRLQQLADTGTREFLAEKGLLLWQLTPFQSRHGERIELALSLFDGAAPEDVVAASVDDHGDAVREHAARATGLAPENILILGRRMKDCCGGGCASCLHSKKGPSRYWTRPPRDPK